VKLELVDLVRYQLRRTLRSDQVSLPRGHRSDVYYNCSVTLVIISLDYQ